MDKNYWEQFYKHKHTIKPTPFAKFVRKFIKEKDLSVVDLGCGNGRDTYYLGKKWQTCGVDEAVLPLNVRYASFVQDDISSFIKSHKTPELVYARFLFHSINNQTLENILDWGADLLAIEIRSIDDDKNLWIYQNHERTLRTNQQVISTLWRHGYDLVYFIESKGLAKYKKEDPLVVRIIAKKCSIWKRNNLLISF